MNDGGGYMYPITALSGFNGILCDTGACILFMGIQFILKKTDNYF